MRLSSPAYLEALWRRRHPLNCKFWMLQSTVQPSATPSAGHPLFASYALLLFLSSPLPQQKLSVRTVSGRARLGRENKVISVDLGYLATLLDPPKRGSGLVGNQLIRVLPELFGGEGTRQRSSGACSRPSLPAASASLGLPVSNTPCSPANILLS